MGRVTFAKIRQGRLEPSFPERRPPQTNFLQYLGLTKRKRRNELLLLPVRVFSGTLCLPSNVLPGERVSNRRVPHRCCHPEQRSPRRPESNACLPWRGPA